MVKTVIASIMITWPRTSLVYSLVEDVRKILRYKTEHSSHQRYNAVFMNSKVWSYSTLSPQS